MVRHPLCIYNTKKGKINSKKSKSYIEDSTLLRNVGDNFLLKSNLRSKSEREHFFSSGAKSPSTGITNNILLQ